MIPIKKELLMDILKYLKETKKQELNTVINKIENILKDTQNKETYINNFKKVFEAKEFKIDTYKMPMLNYIIHEFGEDLYFPSKEHEKLCKEKSNIVDILLNTFNEEQKKLFFEYWELENKMTEEINEQLFMFGFMMANELEQEYKKAREEK